MPTYKRVEIEQNILNFKTKTITAYYGNLIVDEDDEINDDRNEENDSQSSQTELVESVAEGQTHNDLFDTIDDDAFTF